MTRFINTTCIFFILKVDIYFDDAFKRDPNDPEIVSINDFVKDFTVSMDKAARYLIIKIQM